MAQVCSPCTHELIYRITRDDDGAHVVDLLKLLKVAGAQENRDGDQAMRLLATQTGDFERWYQDFIKRL